MRKSLVEYAEERLVEAIVGGEYPDNRLPPQDQLSQQFRASRSVLREAISRLTSRGMLAVRTRSGTKITPIRDWKIVDGDVIDWCVLAQPPDPVFLHDLAQFRAWIEPIAAAQAAVHASEEDRTAIRCAYSMLLSAGERKAYMEADITLHSAIMMSSGNQLLRQMLGPVRAAILNAHVGGQALMTRNDAELETMARLIDAIDARDATDAGAAMAELTGFEG